jgi:RNA polymerase sigma-70 factor (ECF subfamily)
LDCDIYQKEKYLQALNWQVILQKHAKLVWQTSYRLLGERCDAEDCFQETFISALKTAKRQRIRNISALLVHLATRRAIDMLRKRCSQLQADISNIDTTRLQSSNPGPLQQVYRDEVISRLRKALTELPEQQANAFCMRYLSDMSQKQIAERLGVTANAAGVLVHRAKESLQEIFKRRD